MNWSTIESGWKDYQSNAKQQWSKLSDEQVEKTLGKREDLSSQVQQAYSVSKEDAERQISEWQSRQVEKPAPAAP
jgi:uncharacterized protein YjbJ (UPF0337 family)